MTKTRYLHTPPSRDDLHFRRKVPEEHRALFNCGDFYKVPLGTKDPRVAEALLAIANGEYEKVATFRQALKEQGGGTLSQDEAQALVVRYLTGRSGLALLLEARRQLSSCWNSTPQ